MTSAAGVTPPNDPGPYALSEAWASIRMNLSTTFAATMTVLIGMCLLGLFIALGTWVLSWSNHIQKELEVKVLFCTSVVPQKGCDTGATPAQEQAVEVQLSQDRRIKTVTFWSRRNRPRRDEEDGIAHVRGGPPPSNPFPDEWGLNPAQAKWTRPSSASRSVRPTTRASSRAPRRASGTTAACSGAARSRNTCSRSPRWSRSSSS